MESFDSTKTSLSKILSDVHEGRIQLPDFQRGWVWDDNRIKGILASIAKSFPIGAIMLLETGNDSVRFKNKPLEGVRLSNPVSPEMLILDGQQRITSLYQAIITNEVVLTRNDKNYEIKRWYYIDMKKAMDENLDLEEAIISINESKQITANIGRDILLDLSKAEYEYEKLMYPVCMVDEYSTWRKEYNKYWKHDSEKIEFWDSFEEKIINNFNKYMLPVIVMKKSNPKEAVCQVFEKVNTGGVSLTVFELLTASFSAEEFDLKHDWEEIKTKFQEHKVLQNTENTDVIQSITLLSTYKKRLARKVQVPQSEEMLPVSCKRKEMLNLSLQDYKLNRAEIVQGFIKAAKILVENHVYSARDLPYNTQLIPLAAILAVLGQNIDNIGNKNKLMQWYWCGVLGELYGSANETRYALDLPQVVDWIANSGAEPKTVYDANFSPSRLHTLKSRNSAAYKGIYALLMDGDVRDWLSATRIDLISYFSESIDIHHIFPVAWCEKNSVSPADFNCIINKTPLSGRTNRFVSGDAPCTYLSRLAKQSGVGESEYTTILRSHLVEPSYLFANSFPAFFADRKNQLLQRIEKAMGKTIPRDAEVVEEGVYVESGPNEDEKD